MGNVMVIPKSPLAAVFLPFFEGGAEGHGAADDVLPGGLNEALMAEEFINAALCRVVVQ